MWDELESQVALQVEQLNRLLEVNRSLLAKCITAPPDRIELAALAAMLHSFYTGVENIFKRVAIAVDDEPASGAAWHSQLLDRMAVATAKRPPAISAPLAELLRPYLQFRHVFRHSYSFELQWDKMKPLVIGCEDVFKQCEAEFQRFVKLSQGR